MGLKEKIIQELIARQMSGGAELGERINKVIDDALAVKIEKMKKEGKEITEDSLIKGWQGLRVLGVTEEMMREKARKRLTT